MQLIALPYALSFLFLELFGTHPLWLRFRLNYFLPICFIFDMGSVGVHGVPVPRVDAWMENTHDTYLLNLYKREEWTFFERSLAKGLAKVMAILVEVDNSSIHVNQHSYDWANYKLVVSWLLGYLSVIFCWTLRIKVSSPFFLGENISCI